MAEQHFPPSGGDDAFRAVPLEAEEHAATVETEVGMVQLAFPTATLTRNEARELAPAVLDATAARRSLGARAVRTAGSSRYSSALTTVSASPRGPSVARDTARDSVRLRRSAARVRRSRFPDRRPSRVGLHCGCVPGTRCRRRGGARAVARTGSTTRLQKPLEMSKVPSESTTSLLVSGKCVHWALGKSHLDAPVARRLSGISLTGSKAIAGERRGF
jgi:hypothetical protein